MKIVIYVRHDVDWQGMTFEKFMNQPQTYGPGGHMWDNVLRWFKSNHHILDWWDDMFTWNYFEFRAKVKELAESTLPDTTIIKGHDALLEECENQDDAYIVPIDDDDWLAPNLLQFLSSRDEAVVHWKMQDMVPPNIRIRHRLFRTCSFAVKKKVVINHPRLKTLLSHHCCTGDYLRKRKHRTIILKNTLSMVNRTVASVGRLRSRYVASSKKRGDHEQRFKEHMFREANRIIKMTKSPKRAVWASPYLEQNSLLHRKLLGNEVTML
jgi:hypothetical protein